MPVNIDIDVKVEKIHVYPLVDGMKAMFELRDANNPETKLYLMFYKRQIDYIMKQFYEVDKEKIRKELTEDFETKERIFKEEIKQHYYDREVKLKEELTIEITDKLVQEMQKDA